MTGTDINITSDKMIYEKNESIKLLAICTGKVWDKLIVQVYDDTGKKIAEKDWKKADDIDGHVDWTVPSDIFKNSDPQYAAIVLCKNLKASVRFQHY